MPQRISDFPVVQDDARVRSLIEREYERTGGVFRLAPAWVGRPGIIIPGRRIKLADEYMSRTVAVNERWLASVTYSDNGAYNHLCPEDHGLSYIVLENNRVQLKRAMEVCGELLLGKGKKWDVLPKFFDNNHRIPFHMHPCDSHCAPGLLGKPESYHFPVELNMDRNAFPSTPIGVDPYYSDDVVRSYLRRYFDGNNQLTDLSNTINILPGTGWYMPPCTLHAPGSLVTYELQVASDVACIPESRVNDMVMPEDMLDRDLPVKAAADGVEAVVEYMLSMIRCKDSGNGDDFRQEYFRPPISTYDGADGARQTIIYRTGRLSEKENPDLYSSKRTVVYSGKTMEIRENAAFGTIVLGGHGEFQVAGKEPVAVESASMFATRDDLGGDEVFVAAGAARELAIRCRGIEDMRVYQHFASNSNPETRSLAVPEYSPFF